MSWGTRLVDAGETGEKKGIKRQYKQGRQKRQDKKKLALKGTVPLKIRYVFFLFQSNYFGFGSNIAQKSEFGLKYSKGSHHMGRLAPHQEGYLRCEKC